MTDVDTITALIYLYAERLDAGDFEGVARLFAGATFRSDRRAETRRGRDEVLTLFRNTVALYDGRPCTKHVTTNLIIDVDQQGATASARSYYTVLQARPELALQVVIAGRYHDRFEKVESVWRFTDRFVFVDLVGDLRFHLRHNPLGTAGV
jgi:3-phenylpropionate/cinnamic acid dioxygenase small subunit